MARRSLIRKPLKEFFNDFAGAGAVLEPSPSQAVQGYAPTFLAVTGIMSALRGAKDFAVDILGISGTVLPVFVGLVGLSSCIIAISLKTRFPDQYKFGKWTRSFARLGTLMLLVILPYNVSAALEELLPLPGIIAGKVLDSPSQEPVPSARVRLMSADGVDITQSDLTSQTGTDGVFIVHSSRPPRRTGKLVVYRDGCKTLQAPMWHRFEITPPPSVSVAHFFLLRVECQK